MSKCSTGFVSVCRLGEAAGLIWTRINRGENDPLMKFEPASVSSRFATVRSLFDRMPLEIWARYIGTQKKYPLPVAPCCNLCRRHKEPLTADARYCWYRIFRDALSTLSEMRNRGLGAVINSSGTCVAMTAVYLSCSMLARRQCKFMKGPTCFRCVFSFSTAIGGSLQRLHRLWCSSSCCNWLLLYRWRGPLILFFWGSSGSLQRFVREIWVTMGEAQQASAILLDEERREWLQHQIGTRCQICCVETKEIVGALSPSAVDDEVNGSLMIQLGNCSALTSAEGVDDHCVQDFVAQSALTGYCCRLFGVPRIIHVSTAAFQLDCGLQSVLRTRPILQVGQWLHVMREVLDHISFLWDPNETHAVLNRSMWNLNKYSLKDVFIKKATGASACCAGMIVDRCVVPTISSSNPVITSSVK